MSQSKNGSDFTVSFLGGAIVGGLIGAAVGILFAPQSGTQTREQLKQTGKKAYNETLEKVEEFKQTNIEPKVENAKKVLSEKLEEANKEITKKTKEITDELSKK